MNDFFIRACVDVWDVNEKRAPTLHEALQAFADELERDADQREKEVEQYRLQARIARSAAVAALAAEAQFRKTSISS